MVPSLFCPIPSPASLVSLALPRKANRCAKPTRSNTSPFPCVRCSIAVRVRACPSPGPSIHTAAANLPASTGHARYTHEFMELRDGVDFEQKIFVKQHAADLLRQELRHVKPGEEIAMGTATDPINLPSGALRLLVRSFKNSPAQRPGPWHRHQIESGPARHGSAAVYLEK